MNSNPNMMNRQGTIEERLWRSVCKTSTCWIWTGALDKDGFGKLRRLSALVRAHRLSWELKFGPTDRLHLIVQKCGHLCCVNPDHLFSTSYSNLKYAGPPVEHLSGEAVLEIRKAATTLTKWPGTIEDRFWRKTIVCGEDLCWPWIGSKPSGYGLLKTTTGAIGAHRLSWIIHNGQIPDGLWVLHKCDNPECVNPGHLFVGTPKDNSLDREAKGRGKPHRGERSWNAKLTAESVVKIRSMIQAAVPLVTIAALFQVSPSTISYIGSRKAWKHVE